MAVFKPTPARGLSGWYSVPGYPYFLANRQGKIRNAKTGYETLGSLDDKGYRRVCQWDNTTKTKKEYKAHQIVCAAFYGPCPSPQHEVGHKDDDRANNVPGNLQWITRKDNMSKANKKRVSTEARTVFTATLITGNPKYIHNNPQAQNYYDEIVSHLEDHGFAVTVDPGEAYTCPIRSDLYIGHSRGAGRYRCVEDDPLRSWRFLRFGDLDGISHPVDRAYQEKYKAHFGTDKRIPPPPKEHYVFTNEQKEAIDALVEDIHKGRVSMESSLSDSAYVARMLSQSSQSLLADMQSRLGLTNPIPTEEMHLTLMYSPVDGMVGYQPLKRPLVTEGQWKVEHLGDKKRTVAIVLSGDLELQMRHRELSDLGAQHTFTPFMAHVSLSYDDQVDKSVIESINWGVDRKLTFIKEYAEPIEDDDDVSVESQLPTAAPMSLHW